MPSINYYNQSAPFWDWIASMEEQGRNNPWSANRGEQANAFGGNNDNNQAFPGAHPPPPFPPMGPFGDGLFPHPHGAYHQPPPPPPPPQSQQPPPPPHPPQPAQAEAETNENKEGNGEAGPSGTAGQADEQAHTGARPWNQGTHQRTRGCGTRGRGWGSGRGSGRGGAPFSGRGGWGSGRGGGLFGGPNFGPGGLNDLANMFQEQLFGNNDNKKKDGDEDFQPEVDVFDTSEAFVVHVSLPGAKKEDVGVNWDAEKSELSIAGVVYRPGDEEFLQTLAMNERKIGAFERKVRLGSRANPAAVDVDGIHAKMEDGILKIELNKLDGGYVEVKKVDIE